MLARFTEHRNWMTMNSWSVIMIFSVFSNCNWAYNIEDLPSIENEDFIKLCVNSHNQFRSKVYPKASNMLRMSWDPHLAKVANEWTRRCEFDNNIDLNTPQKLHPIFATLGENIWVGPALTFSEYSAIKSWNDEVENYDFNSENCTEKCRNYIHIIWASTYKVGCAVRFCPNIAGLPYGAIFVCDYGPQGNYLYMKPYKKGEPCSACKEDICLDQLCANPERDGNLITESEEKAKSQISYALILVPVFLIVVILLVILMFYYKRYNTSE